MNGFFNIGKPAGMSSAAVVAVMRRLTGEKRTGHAGTLDPEAAGVLPIMTGKATRLFDYLVDKEKEYEAVCAFGTATDTQDATGTAVETGENYPDLDTVKEKARELTGEIRQRPSMYSAIKVGGKPLYARARKGETVEVPERTVIIHSIEVLGEEEDHGVRLRVKCGKGTYIRTLCDDLGKKCGCPAHMRSLLRTRSGAFSLETALTLEEARALAAEGKLTERMMAPDAPLQHLRAVEIPDRWEKQANAGGKIPAKDLAEDVPEEENLRAYLDGQFQGILHRSGEMLVWKMHF
ncbi:MAG: tRNA pseudouridine(55) synthase TruB [Clostridia bacterium]